MRAPFYVQVWSHAPHDPIVGVTAELAPFERYDDATLNASLAPLLPAASGGRLPPHILDMHGRWRGTGEALRARWSELRALDRRVGSLLHTIDGLGLRNRTLVAFSSECPCASNQLIKRACL